MTVIERSPVRRAVVDGASIAWQSVGDGPAEIVLVPGFASHLPSLWEPGGPAAFVHRLAERARVVVYDRRGQGLSDRRCGPGSVEQDVADLLGVLDGAGLARPVVVGLSQGGAAAVAFAATHPSRTGAVALYGAYARAARGDGYPLGPPADALTSFAGAVADRWGTQALAAAFAPSAATDPVFLAWWSTSCARALTPEEVRTGLERRADLDVRDLVRAVQAPALVVHRTGDRINPVEHGRWLADQLPDARLVELPGEDHLWWLPRPEPVADLVLELMDASR